MRNGRVLRAMPSLSLVAWVYISVVVVLWGWVGASWLAFRWTPVVITSDSMSPGLQAGDVVMVGRPGEGRLTRGLVVTYRDTAGDRVTHRIEVVRPDGRYETKGDANRTVDAAPISQDEIVGVARLVVPVVGRPFVWLARQTGALVIWGLVTVLAVVVVALPASRRDQLELADA